MSVPGWDISNIQSGTECHKEDKQAPRYVVEVTQTYVPMYLMILDELSPGIHVNTWPPQVVSLTWVRNLVSVINLLPRPNTMTTYSFSI
jgi:hypothetical protein